MCGVLPRQTYEAGPNNTRATIGPLTIAPYEPPALDDLVANGFPFLRQSFVAEANVELPSLPVGIPISFADTHGAAAPLAIDGRSHGWAGPPDFR